MASLTDIDFTLPMLCAALAVIGTLGFVSRPHISVFIAQSLDGYIATDDDQLDWLTKAASDDENYGFDDFLANIDLVAMGRSTYEFIKDLPELPYGDRPVHVFTNRSVDPRDGFTFYAKNPVDAVSDWHHMGFGRVYVDGGNLISQFLQAGLVDEMTITVAPILLGSGKRLFHRIPSTTPLQLVNSKSFPSGMVTLQYQRS